MLSGGGRLELGELVSRQGGKDFPGENRGQRIDYLEGSKGVETPQTLKEAGASKRRNSVFGTGGQFREAGHQ